MELVENKVKLILCPQTWSKLSIVSAAWKSSKTNTTIKNELLFYFLYINHTLS
jgi:hypothetical protein